MAWISGICAGFAILVLININDVDASTRIIRSPQFSQASAQAQAGGFGRPQIPPPGPGFGRPFGPGGHSFGGGSGYGNPGFGGFNRPGYYPGSGRGFNGNGGGSISISKSISISRGNGGAASSANASSRSGK